VTESSSADAGRLPVRPEVERAEEHGAVARLVDGLLPELITKLVATGLAELEVREGSWKVRLRRPLELVGTGRRAADRQFRLPVMAGAAPHPTPVGALPGHSPAAGSRSQEARLPVEPEVPVATAPAVGIFRPRAGINGTRVRSGDRLGAVEMLGIPQEILAPIDGIVGGMLAEPGEGVEYGQPLIEMRPVGAPTAATSAPTAATSAPAAAALEPATPAVAAAGERP
jgi:acetyl-CoA carboxylase biotin carboxyl carrier protein